MKATHTPGPWKIGKFDDRQITFDIVANGYVSDVLPGLAAGRTKEDAEANARLIANAPSMKDALWAIANMQITEHTNRAEVLALCMSIARCEMDKLA